MQTAFLPRTVARFGFRPTLVELGLGSKKGVSTTVPGFLKNLNDLRPQKGTRIEFYPCPASELKKRRISFIVAEWGVMFSILQWR
jgi:hypothetical protein